MLEKLLGRLPKKKTQEELDDHYNKMEQVELENGDLAAMLIAGLITIVLPLSLILGGLYTLIYVVFVK